MKTSSYFIINKHDDLALVTNVFGNYATKLGIGEGIVRKPEQRKF